MSATTIAPTPGTFSWKIPSPPPPDSPEGRVLIYALIIGISYVLLLVADAATLASLSAAFVPLPLILGTIASFAVGGMLVSEYARIRLTELELARTVSVRGSADEMPSADSPLGQVMKEYGRSAIDFRRAARSHAYAAGPILWGTLLAFASTVIWGIGFATSVTWTIDLALVIEIPALMLLTFGVAVLGTTIGIRQPVAGYDWLTPNRWRQYDRWTPAVDEAVRTCRWLDEFEHGLRTRFLGGAPDGVEGPWTEK